MSPSNNAREPHQVEGWDGYWYPLVSGLSRADALTWAQGESASRCDVRVVDGDGKSIARWLMGDRTVA